VLILDKHWKQLASCLLTHAYATMCLVIKIQSIKGIRLPHSISCRHLQWDLSNYYGSRPTWTFSCAARLCMELQQLHIQHLHRLTPMPSGSHPWMWPRYRGGICYIIDYWASS